MTYFSGKTIIITGATSGIGEAIALQLAPQNTELVIAGRNEAKLKELNERVVSAGSKCHSLKFDLSSRQSVEAAISYIRRNFDHVDVLINNGGISQRALAEETKEEVVREIMETNFFGTVAFTLGVLPLMTQKGGRIAVTSSLMGKFATKYRSSYAASKHALHGYFEALRFEVMEKGIDITMVCPGYIKTNISVNALDKEGTKYGYMDKGQAKGMSAEKCARKYLHSIAKRKKEKYIGGGELLGIYLKRYLPWLFYRIIGLRKGV